MIIPPEVFSKIPLMLEGYVIEPSSIGADVDGGAQHRDKSRFRNLPSCRISPMHFNWIIHPHFILHGIEASHIHFIDGKKLFLTEPFAPIATTSFVLSTWKPKWFSTPFFSKRTYIQEKMQGWRIQFKFGVVLFYLCRFRTEEDAIKL
ncbi:hypothetical protein [Brevibacillus agri]|uniref:hypothetical protein n=1 Tax=Brevibacillus agri TaxID=51101 RepID=UPI0030845896